MWVAKIKLKHDCILGNRCEKYKVILQSFTFSTFKQSGAVATSSMHYISGDSADIEEFVRDLRKDKNVIKLERKKDMFLLLEKAESKAVAFFTPKIIFIKPVLIDLKGYETWEIGSWEKEEVSRFITKVEKRMDYFELIKFQNITLDTVFFPRIMPNLSEKQKRAIDLAIQKGYYKVPRLTNLRNLAKLMGISLSTFEQHLRVAEHKIIPDLISYSK